MSLAPFLVAFFLLRYLFKFLAPIPESLKSSKPLNVILSLGIGILCLEAIFRIEDITKWLWHLGLITIIAIIYKKGDLKHTRIILTGVIPFILIRLFSDSLELLDKKLHDSWSDYIGAATVFSFIWLGAMWIGHTKRQKALQKEQLERQLQDEQNRLVALRKEELEVMITERTAELMSQKEDLQKALIKLSTMQAQLIQQEKLASLGELTAGIAHEIQNPLNFVNNFSEVSAELIEELQQDQRKKKRNLDGETEILDMLKENMSKINHHGKRADAIVKGMLLHSRSSSNKIEPTDINALADEYLRLSYHGLRAKDKNFNALLEIDFDKSIGMVNVLAQDLGRVILNLLTNAFYSVNQKRKQNFDGYEPSVWVQTKKLKDKIVIKIKDNGLGIPENVLDKIYQPFFTTKPTGEGTGLGLSLSYDIITKAHHGQMQVKTEENKYAEFSIFIPLNLV